MRTTCTRDCLALQNERARQLSSIAEAAEPAEPVEAKAAGNTHALAASDDARIATQGANASPGAGTIPAEIGAKVDSGGIKRSPTHKGKTAKRRMRHNSTLTAAQMEEARKGEGGEVRSLASMLPSPPAIRCTLGMFLSCVREHDGVVLRTSCCFALGVCARVQVFPADESNDDSTDEWKKTTNVSARAASKSPSLIDRNIEVPKSIQEPKEMSSRTKQSRERFTGYVSLRRPCSGTLLQCCVCGAC